MSKSATADSRRRDASRSSNPPSASNPFRSAASSRSRMRSTSISRSGVRGYKTVALLPSRTRQPDNRREIMTPPTTAPIVLRDPSDDPLPATSACGVPAVAWVLLASPAFAQTAPSVDKLVQKHSTVFVLDNNGNEHVGRL